MRLGSVPTGVALAGAIVVFASPAAAQSDDGDLRALVEAQRELLERQSAQIDALEDRVRQLEGTAAVPTAGPGTNRATAQGGAEPNPVQQATVRAAASGTDVGRFPDDAVVRAGEFDRAITIPGTDLSMRLGGFAQLDAIYDTAEIASEDAFLARAIPIGGSGENAARMTARNTRFNVDVRGPSPLGPFRAFFEADFAGSGGNELVSNSTSFRLRHAFGQLGPFYAGQYWSTFVDVSAFPETLDTTSPAGKSVTRQAGIRYVARLGRGVSAALAVENPETDAVLPAGEQSAAVERAPDLHGYLRLERPKAHVQLAGVLRSFAVNGPAGDRSVMGWGLNLTGRLNAPFLNPRDNLVFGVIGGDGIGRYIVELAGGGNDFVVDPVSGELATITGYGGYAGYQHWWGEALRSTLTFGRVELGLPSYLTADGLASATTASVNLLWNPIRPVTAGTEVLWGRRVDGDGKAADAFRLQTVLRYSF